jgi:hypothetical protein
MNDLNRPWGSGPQGEHPTEQFWPGSPPPAGQPGKGGSAGPGRPGPGWQGPGEQPYPGWQQSPGLDEYRRRDRRRAHHWTLGIAAAALLAVGGVVAALSLTGHATPTAAVSPANGAGGGAQGAPAQGAAAGPSGQAAMLNATLSGANSPGPLTVTSSAAAVAGQSQRPAGAAAAHRAAAACAKARQFATSARKAGFGRLARLNRMAAHRCRIARRHFAHHVAHRRMFRFFLLHGVDGQYTFQTPKGTKTQAYERGVIQSVSAGHSLVVKASNGDVWTWDLTSSTVVRDRSGKVAQSSLANGQTVWAGGPVVSGAKDAGLIVVNPPTPHAGH